MLCGPRAQAQVRQRLAEARLFVLACVPEAGGGSDNLPTVIMEAMACGLPVISTRLAGVPEMIESGVEGWLVEPRDAEALAGAAARFLTNQAEAEGFGERARAAAREKFAIEKTTSALKHLLVERAGVPAPPMARQADLALREKTPGWLARWWR